MECIGCTETISHLALLECGHSSACPLCILRLRLLLHDNRCPECRHISEMVFVADSGTYESYANNMWGDRPMNGFKEYENSKIFFQTEAAYSEFAGLMLFVCQVCNKSFKAQGPLLNHLPSHGLTMCDLCLAHKTVFIAEQDLFTAEELKVHKEEGDVESGSPGHPRCRLCSRFVYDDKTLIQHIRDHHYFCDLCPVDSRPAFSGYDGLERHYDKHHFLCGITSCKRAKHVVFSTWDELISHHRAYHAGLELPVFKPSFRGAADEYIPKPIPDAPVKPPGAALSEERKNEEFPALGPSGKPAAELRGAWGDDSDPLRKLNRPAKKRQRRVNPDSLPTVLLNPITFHPTQKPVPSPREETKAWPSPQPKQPQTAPTAPVVQKPQKVVYTPKDFPSLVTDEAKPFTEAVSLESQVALLNRKQVSKEEFIEWFIETVAKEKAREQFPAIFAGLSDRRLAEAVVAGIEGRAKQSKKDMMESDFPALVSPAPAKSGKKSKEKKVKQQQQSSAWGAVMPVRVVAEPPVNKGDFPTLPQTQAPEKPDFPELPQVAQTDQPHNVPEHVRIVKDNLLLMSSGAISKDDFIQAYLQVVPHLQQLSNELLTILRSANQTEIIQELWARVDKSIPARTIILDKYKDELDAQLHLYRYAFITREKFVEEYIRIVEQPHWVNREVMRYIRVSVPGESLIEAIEQKNREVSLQYVESQYPSLPRPQTKSKKKGK